MEPLLWWIVENHAESTSVYLVQMTYSEHERFVEIFGKKETIHYEDYSGRMVIWNECFNSRNEAIEAIYEKYPWFKKQEE